MAGAEGRGMSQPGRGWPVPSGIELKTSWQHPEGYPVVSLQLVPCKTQTPGVKKVDKQYFHKNLWYPLK